LRRRAAAREVALATYPGVAAYWASPRLARLREAGAGFCVRMITAERDADIALDDADLRDPVRPRRLVRLRLRRAGSGTGRPDCRAASRCSPHRRDPRQGACGGSPHPPRRSRTTLVRLEGLARPVRA
jgi:hypothetical protein